MPKKDEEADIAETVLTVLNADGKVLMPNFNEMVKASIFS